MLWPLLHLENNSRLPLELLVSWVKPNAERRTPNAERRTPNAERRTPNAERRTPNAERRMHCLLAVSFTCVCLRLAFICWKGPTTIKCCPFQQIKANRKQTQVKLTASKQCIRRSAFGVRRSAFGVRRFTPAGGPLHAHMPISLHCAVRASQLQ